MENKKPVSLNKSSYFKFLIPSIIGIILFMTPLNLGGEITIPVAFFAKVIMNNLSDILPAITVGLIVISLIGTLATKLFKPKSIKENIYFKNLFDVDTIWIIARILGAILVVASYFKIGPEFLWSENTGGLLLYSLLPILFSVFLFAGLLLPLILDFGLLEFFGTLLTKVMRPIFSLPGRSAIDCITSWLGDGTIGVLLTSKQYEEGYYSEREAAIIGTSFSAVSITFSLVVIAQVNLAHLFLPFYLTVTLAGIVAAIITPHIPPLSKKPDTYYGGVNNNGSEEIPKGYTSFKWGLEKAVDRAGQNNSPKKFFVDGAKNVLDMWIGVTPMVMAFGTIALIIAEYTPIFQWLGMPFIPVLKLLQIPEATAASQTLIVGFADMFLPSVLGATIQSDMTRFIIAAVSVTQLIYMSEVGGLLLGSKIPVNFKELFIIFIERTLITLPVVSIIAHIIF